MTLNMRFTTVLMFAVIHELRAKSSTSGREFFFGILKFGEDSSQNKDNIIAIDVTNVSPQDVHIRMKVPFFQKDDNYTIPKGQGYSFPIDFSIQKQGTFKEARGIQINSDNDVNVIISNAYDRSNSIDVYNVLPVTSIRERYKVLTYRGYHDPEYGSAFLVAGVNDNTNLTIYFNGSGHFVLLDSLEVYQYVCPGNCDLSGTLLVSDKKIAVIAGAPLSESSINGNDYLASEMIPASLWTNSYIVPPLLPQPGFTLRTISEYASLIKFTNATHSFSSIADLSEMYFENLPVILYSSTPFSVCQYGYGWSNTGDPFMAFVPGIEQYVNSYIFKIPHMSYGNTRPYIAMIVPITAKDTVMLDDLSVQYRNMSSGGIKQLSVPYPFDNYTVLTFQTTEGVHHFWHPRLDVLFGIFVYGLGLDMGYGFYAGYDLEGKEAASSVIFPTKETTESHEHATDSGKTVSYTTEVQMCYQCNDLTHPDLCDTVQKCALNEVCYLESYMVSGQRKYRSGCISASVCEADHNEALISGNVCYECCYNSYCNNEGCGEGVIPDRNSRGPFCFHCDYVYSIEECLKVEPCSLHEACYIEQYSWLGGKSRYRMGCGHSPAE